MNFLLNDEKEISKEDFLIRKKLYDELSSLPVTSFSKMRHFQPQIGCYNNCSFCSKSAICKCEQWSVKSLRNIICSIKTMAKNYTKDDLLLAWDRKEHRIGVVFPYLNNDIGSYNHLYEYINLCYKELGVRTRISTVGFSRHNKILNEMHKKIGNDLNFALAGVRLSLSQYGRAWEDNSGLATIEEYTKDIANFLKIYRKYFEEYGSGYRKMCVEIRYNPLVQISDVFVLNYKSKMIIGTKNYLYISKDTNIELKEAHVIDPYKHSLELSEEPKIFTEYNLLFNIENEKQIIDAVENNKLEKEKEVEVYLFKNKDGIYYAINPKLTKEGNYGINIYPKTEIRKKSGYLITERFFINAMYNYKKKQNKNLSENLENTNFENAYELLNILEEYAKYYDEKNKLEKSNYIRMNVITLLKVYIKALEEAEYNSDVFFDKNFTIDTGTICNLGRAQKLFKGITNFSNEPLTPTHERNYGRFCSTMKEENYAWLIACDYDDSLVIEKLDLFNTASLAGQLSLKNKISLPNFNEKIKELEKYLYPGATK